MKFFSGLMLAVGVAALLASSAGAAQAGKRGAAPKSAQEMLQAQYDNMVRECKLTEDQQKTLKEKVKAKQDALEAWEKANAEKVKAAEDAVRAARTGDAAAKKKAGDDMRALQADRAKATEEADKAIQAALTPEQAAAWDGYELFETTSAKYKRANPTDDQTAKIKSACMTASKDLAGFTGDDKKDKTGRKELQACLKWAIENVILTPDQAAMFAKKVPAAAPATPAPAAPAATTPAAPETKPAEEKKADAK